MLNYCKSTTLLWHVIAAFLLLLIWQTWQAKGGLGQRTGTMESGLWRNKPTLKFWRLNLKVNSDTWLYTEWTTSLQRPSTKLIKTGEWEKSEVQTERFLHLTQDTTLPLKHGSLAPSSDISSFTTLEKTKHRRGRMWGLIMTFLLEVHSSVKLSKQCAPTLLPQDVNNQSITQCRLPV